MHRFLMIAAAAVMLTACGAEPAADQAAAPDAPAAAPVIAVDDAWTRALPPVAPAAPGFMVIRNTGTAPDRLIGVESALAARNEVHTMAMEDGVMKMRPVEAIEIPAGGEAVLAPGGDHVMFIELAAPFEAGTTVEATLIFATAGRIPVPFEVRGRAAPGADQGSHGDHGGN